MKLRFGRIVAPALGPGLHYRLPWPIESDRVVSLASVRRAEFGFPRAQVSREELTRRLSGDRGTIGGNPVPDAMTASRSMFQREAGPEDSFLLSGDANLIDLRSVIQYRVTDALAYAYEVVDPDALVRATALAALRDVIAQHAIDAIYTTAREDIEREVSRIAQAKLDLYGAGVEVVTFRLLYVHPPDAVHDAFRDVASAQEDKLRTINRANIFAVEKVNQAKGEAAAKLEQALAARDQDIKHAEGDAAAFTLRLDAYRKAPELTMYRLQLETIGCRAARRAEDHSAGCRRGEGFRPLAPAAVCTGRRQVRPCRARRQVSEKAGRENERSSGRSRSSVRLVACGR